MCIRDSANLSSNLLNEVGLSLFLYFEVGLRVCNIVVKKFTFAISSPDEFLLEMRTEMETMVIPRNPRISRGYGYECCGIYRGRGMYLTIAGFPRYGLCYDGNPAVMVGESIRYFRETVLFVCFAMFAFNCCLVS